MRDAIENILRDYYKKQWKLRHVISQIEKLNEDIENIKYRICESIDIIRMPGIAKGVPIQAVNSYSEGLERSMAGLEKNLASLKAELGEKAKKRNSLEMKQRALEEDMHGTGIELCMRLMTDTEIKVLEQKFVYRRDFSDIGRALHLSRNGARYWYTKALDRIGEDLNIA